METSTGKQQAKRQKKPVINLLDKRIDDFEVDTDVPLFKVPQWMQPHDLKMIMDYLDA